MPGYMPTLTLTGIVADQERRLRRERAAQVQQSPLWKHDRFVAPTVYQLSFPPYGINFLSRNGLILVQDVDYAVSTGGLVSFTVAPSSGDVIAVDYVTTGDLIAWSLPADTGGIADDFNRPDNVSLGVTSVGGVTWTQQHGFGGTIGIVGNKARLPAATIGERFTTVVADTSGSVQVDVPDSTNSNRQAGLTFRYIDSTHFWFVIVNGTQLLVNDQGGSYFTGTGAAGDTIRVDYTPTAFTVYRNGASVYARTDSSYGTSSNVGIYVGNFDGAGGGSVDNFSWTP